MSTKYFCPVCGWAALTIPIVRRAVLPPLISRCSIKTLLLPAISSTSFSTKTTSVYPSTKTAILFMCGRLLCRVSVQEVHFQEGEVAQAGELELLEQGLRIGIVPNPN